MSSSSTEVATMGLRVMALQNMNSWLGSFDLAELAWRGTVFEREETRSHGATGLLDTVRLFSSQF